MVRLSDSRNAQHSNSEREQAQDLIPTQSLKQKRVTPQSRRSVRSSTSFLHAILIVLLCPYIIASIQDAFFFNSGSGDIWAIQSSRSAAFFGGVHAMALPQSHAAKRHQSVFEVERQEEKSTDGSAINGTETSVSLQPEQSQQSIKAVNVPSKRWGHSVVYLREDNVAMFVGGQVSSDNDSMALTNDVYVMDLNTDSNQTWVQISSENLTPHAFASRAVTHDEEGSDERIFIVGGVTNECSLNASQMSMWTAGQSWKDGQWSVPDLSEGAVIPQRRRGARAIQVPVQMSLPEKEAQQAILAGGVSFMVLGGYSDESTCNNGTSVSSNVGIWTMAADAAVKNQADNSRNSSSTLSTRDLVLSPHLTNIPVADYSSIFLPGNGTQSDRVLLLGGMDKNGNLTSFEYLWVLDLTTGLWSRMSTTNATSTGDDVPHGRIGQTSTRTMNGTIIVYGGYTSLDKEKVPTSDVHVLNYTVNPAIWSRVNTSSAPKRAFHTAFMVDQVMVVGFGQGEYQSSSSNVSVSSGNLTGIQSRSLSRSYQAVEFMDTSSINWTWADSMAAVLAARESQVSTSFTSSSMSSSSAPSATATSTTTSASHSTTSAAEVPVTTRASAASTMASPSTAIETAAATSMNDELVTTQASNAYPSSSRNNFPIASSSSPAAEPSTTDTSGSSMTPQTRNTAVIASVLGAAAIAASLFGLYSAHKRREARLNGDNYSMKGDKYEHFSSSAPGPPVSSLWLHQLKRKATLASDAVMNRGRGGQSPRSGAASAGASPRSLMGGYSAPDNESSFRVIRNLPPTSRISMRRNEMMQQEATREQLYIQENNMDNYLDNGFFPFNKVGDGQINGLKIPPPAAYNVRALSSESFESDGGLSHFSYPYLSAMHRLSPGGSPSTNGSPNVSSPHYSPHVDEKNMHAAGEYNNMAMTPTWSPSSDAVEIMSVEKRASFDSIQSNSNPFEQEQDQSAMMVAANCIASPPLFSRETVQDSPMFPELAYLAQEDNQHQSKPHQQSTLRVMNKSDF